MDNIEEFRSTEKLYHYTTLENLKLILKKRQLKFGKLPKMNDINERHKDIYISISNKTSILSDYSFRKIRHELNSIKQISLTQDGLKFGFAISAMWGHYGDNGNGCCIVFRKKTIEEVCKQKKYLFNSICYKEQAQPILYEKNKYRTIHNYLNLESKSLFFTKTSDWSYEQEYRIITTKPNNNFFDFQDSIMAILLYSNSNKSIFSKSDYLNIRKINNDIPILEYSDTYLWGISLNEEGERDWW